MNIRYFVTILFAAAILVLACGKNNESAEVENNGAKAPPAQTIQNTSVETTSTASRDEHGWFHNWDEGLAAAKRENKPILVDFTADWCKWCEVMDEKTFSAPEIKERFASDWITIKVDTDDRETTGTFKDKTLSYRQLAGAFGANSLPSFLFIDRNGEPVTIIAGYREKGEFAPILDYINKELYKENIELGEYIEQHS